MVTIRGLHDYWESRAVSISGYGFVEELDNNLGQQFQERGYCQEHFDKPEALFYLAAEVDLKPKGNTNNLNKNGLIYIPQNAKRQNAKNRIILSN